MVKKEDRFELSGSVSTQFDYDPWPRISQDKLGRGIDGVPTEWAPRYPSVPAVRLLADNLSRIFVTLYPATVSSNRREQYASALVQLTDFLEANDFPPSVISRFIDLVIDLRRLDQGATANWLKAAKDYPNRHVDAPEVWRRRALAAITLEHLATNLPGRIESQAKWVQKCYSQLFPDDPASAAAVRSWREQFKRQTVQDRQAALLFENRAAVIQTICNELKKHGLPETPDTVAEVLLARMVDK